MRHGVAVAQRLEDQEMEVRAMDLTLTRTVALAAGVRSSSSHPARSATAAANMTIGGRRFARVR